MLAHAHTNKYDIVKLRIFILCDLVSGHVNAHIQIFIDNIHFITQKIKKERNKAQFDQSDRTTKIN